MSIPNVYRIQKKALDKIKTDSYSNNNYEIRTNKNLKACLTRMLAKTRVSEEEFDVRFPKLNDIEKKILTLHFGLDGNAPITNEQVAKIMNTTLTNIIRIQRRAFEQIRTNKFKDFIIKL
jgi:DNA-directed RNA polymerase sigma subunit (sigma70/sigma32)